MFWEMIKAPLNVLELQSSTPQMYFKVQKINFMHFYTGMYKKKERKKETEECLGNDDAFLTME